MAEQELTRVDALRRVRMFAHLGDDALNELAELVMERTYSKDGQIFFTGDPGMSLCMVRRGLVKLSLSSPEGREVILDLFGPGESFGELAMLDGELRSANAVAIETTQLLLLGRDDFMRFLEGQPRVAIMLLTDLAQRLRRDAQIVGDGVFLSVSGRLARTILRLAERRGDGRLVTPPLRQETLAAMAGTTRETLNKWLGLYEGQGLIQRETGAIRVLNPDGLQKRIY